ncbi:hypothetical protein KP509_30G036400 [Ceratopteris richardii]|nr:hypothetical protein KP509_30G036400 [Ceratopteris richardii]
MCVATEAKLEATIFKQEPFQGPTVLILELSTATSAGHSVDPLASETLANGKSKSFVDILRDSYGIVHTIELRSIIKDAHASTFRSVGNRTVAGFVLFFPNYSTFLAKPGFYIEDLYVRECFRGSGFGTLLLKSVARLAVELDYGRVEWCVLDWNSKAIKFYEGIGAKLHPEWRICRLTGKSLDVCGA